MLEKILVPLDGSDLGDRILGPVGRILRRNDADVTLLHVVTEDLAGQTFAASHDPVARVRRRIDEIQDRLVESGAHVRSRFVVGDPAARILEVAEELVPALVAMSTHGRTGVARFVRGSVAERVLRRSRFPLLLANPFAGVVASGASVAERRFERILVPLDGSDLSAEVLPLATEVARLDGAELILFHCVELASPRHVAFEGDAALREGQAALEERRRRISAPVPVRTRVVRGLAAESILEAIEQEKPDLVALTTHGRSGLSRWIYGSVAEQLVRSCPCPVLVQRTAGTSEGVAVERARAGAAREPFLVPHHAPAGG